MNEMIERVALALFKSIEMADIADEETAKDFLENRWPERESYYLLRARAAVRAMREPTESMLDAACEVGPDTNSGPFDWVSAETVFVAMIDAALK